MDENTAWRCIELSIQRVNFDQVDIYV